MLYFARYNVFNVLYQLDQKKLFEIALLFHDSAYSTALLQFRDSKDIFAVLQRSSKRRFLIILSDGTSRVYTTVRETVDYIFHWFEEQELNFQYLWRNKKL